MSEEKAFRGASTGHVISTPDIGFMFPAFDNRSTNIYNALYYSRNVLEIHDEFIKGIFNVEKVPMSAGTQKIVFADTLNEALGEDCKLEVVQAVHEDIREKLAMHKENKEVELPEIYVEEVGDILKKNGIDEEKIAAFNQVCEKNFGNSGVLNPSNLVETRKFEMTTGEVKITVDPEHAYRVKTQIIDGVKYILIPADEGVTVNGINVTITE